MAGRRERIPELDGLRVLMIFIVSWYHVWQQSWLMPVIRIDSLHFLYSLDYLVRSGYIWVDGTVLLSVFLLYMPWAEARLNGTPVPDTRDFYFRRAKRILPGYFFIVLLHLFAVALPWGLYTSAPFMVKDLATHLTFTFTLFSDTYLNTRLGGAAWTLAILVQGYALFPLAAGGVRRHPVITLSAMALVCYGFRAWCVWGLAEYNMVVNQLINFLDVYVIGILCAIGDVTYASRRKTRMERKKYRYIETAAATAVFLLSLWALLSMLRIQAGHAADQTQLQKYQMMYRPVFAICFAGMMVSARFTVPPLRKLLGNPVTKFLGAVSMNYYLVHQTVAVHLKRLNIPGHVSEYPNQYSEQPWQTQYTWLCFGISFVLAVLITFLIEKPGGKLFDCFRKKAVPAEPSSSGIQ